MNNLASLPITEHGQIKKMLLPAGWIEGPVKEGPFDVQSLRWFHPPTDDQPRLCLYYRGYPVDETAGDALHALLEAEPHELSAEQLWPVQEVLRDALPGDNFALRNANTGSLRGKRILVVEGTYVPTGWHTFSIFVDVDGSGCIVQELYYTAPQASFDQFFTAAMESMRTIDWQETKAIDTAARAAELGLVDISELEPLQVEDEVAAAPPPAARTDEPPADGIDLKPLTRPRLEQ